MIRINRFRRILLVDDKEVNRQRYTSIILKSLNPYKKTPIVPLISWAQYAEEALTFLKDAREEGHPFNLLVTDLYMAPVDGIWLIKQLRSNDFSPDELDVILVSTKNAAMDRIEEIESVTSDWIDDSGRELKRMLRPEINEGAGTYDHDEKFLEAIWDGVWKRLDERFQESKKISLTPYAGQEQFITADKNLMKRIEYVLEAIKANPQLNVLITGETGTGKEILVNYLHQKSGNRGAEISPIDCTQFIREMMGGELFGHTKGAFTGAIKDRPGPIEKLNEKGGGTIFFDEIGEIPLELQSKLLRLFQNKEIKRVGTNKLTKVSNVYFMFATKKNLIKEVEEEKFREDLYYRIKDLYIEIPPLRNQKEAIPLLVNYFWNKHGRNSVESITTEAINYIAAKDWKGNGRELERYIEVIKANFPERALSVDVLKKHDMMQPDAAITCYIPPELNTLNKRMSHVIFHDILTNCAAKNDAKSPVKKELCFKVAEIYGHWFHNDTKKVRKKIGTKFDQHIRPNGDNCSVCKAIWDSLK